MAAIIRTYRMVLPVTIEVQAENVRVARNVATHIARKIALPDGATWKGPNATPVNLVR